MEGKVSTVLGKVTYVTTAKMLFWWCCIPDVECYSPVNCSNEAMVMSEFSLMWDWSLSPSYHVMV